MTDSDARSNDAAMSGDGEEGVEWGPRRTTGAAPRAMRAEARRRINTDGASRVTGAPPAGPMPLERRRSWDHVGGGGNENLFDLDILTKTSFGFDRDHQVHIPDDEEDEAQADLEAFVNGEQDREDAQAVSNGLAALAADEGEIEDEIEDEPEALAYPTLEMEESEQDELEQDELTPLRGKGSPVAAARPRTNGAKTSPREQQQQQQQQWDQPREKRVASFDSGGLGSPHSRQGKQPWFRWRLFWAYTGPGWLMSVAYLDPGNIESDLQAGGYSGYQLLWVLSLSTLLGFFLQVLAARLGVATGKNLAENCREYYGKTDTIVLYLMMQLAIIGSDIQEIVGSAIAFRVLFGIPLWVGCLVTGLDTLTFLGLHVIGVRQLELFFVLLIGAMCLCFFATFLSDPADPLQMAEGLFVPYVHERASVQAVSILGAVVMPHNIYLHSALVLSRDIDRHRESKVAEANKYFAIEAGLALLVSLLINVAVVAVFAHGFYSPTCQAISHPLTLSPSAVQVEPPFACVPRTVLHHTDKEAQFSPVGCVTETGVEGTCMPIGLQGAAHALEAFLGPGASTLWAIGLLAAGQSSTMTGTYAGQFVMEGFLLLEIPNWVRVAITRAISLIPATVVAVLANSNFLAADRLDEGLNVLQSLQLPFALLPLLAFTSSSGFMGSFANSRLITAMGWAATALVLSINAYLVGNSVDLRALGLLEAAVLSLAGALYVFFVARIARDAWRGAALSDASSGKPVRAASTAAFTTVDKLPLLEPKDRPPTRGNNVNLSPASIGSMSYGSLD